MKTTLGAPLTPEEYWAMENVLNAARAWLDEIPPGLPPEQLLTIATKMVDYGFKLRSAVQDGFSAANQRMLRPKSFERGVVHPPRTLPDLGLSEISQSEIEAIIRKGTVK